MIGSLLLLLWFLSVRLFLQTYQRLIRGAVHAVTSPVPSSLAGFPLASAANHQC